MNTRNIGIEADGELVFVTVAKYKLFLSYDKVGMDAYLLYSHLMFTARLQATNSVKASEMYIRKGLHWGQERFYKAKNLLADLDLIKQTIRKDEKGQVKGHFLEVRTIKTPFEIEKIQNPDHSKPEHGLQGDKCFNEEVKCFNEEKNTCETSFHQEIIGTFSKEYEQRYKAKLVFSKKEIGCVTNIRKAFDENFPAPADEFQARFEVFCDRIDNADYGFFSTVKVTPSVFVSVINDLVGKEETVEEQIARIRSQG